jgi:ribA/ribD-fused uncharacterized protein
VNYKCDTDSQVFFYEQEFYCLSNFSSFRLLWRNIDFDTSEHAYHYAKFDWGNYNNDAMHPGALAVIRSRSAHDAFKMAQYYKNDVNPEWNNIKLDVMRNILKTKVNQHSYVKKKLLETGDRELIEDSWRDAFWGWGPNKDGQNMLGKLWMEIRNELRYRE